MANITKILNSTKLIGSIYKLINCASISTGCLASSLKKCKVLATYPTCNLHTTPAVKDLFEFFDDKKNWGENEVKVGRSWRKDELRIKSNSDLHKLWFVLLKEKNMLLTMENECNDKMELFPSPERLDKIKDSMENLEEVVRERNKAYHLLETGETGERPGRVVANQLGMRYFYRSSEHIVPPQMNGKWFKTRKFGYSGYAVRKFLLFYREKLYNQKRKAKNRDQNHIIKLLRRYPDTNLDLLKEKYPALNINKIFRNNKCRGHFVPKI